MNKTEAVEYGLRWKNAICDRGDTEWSEAIQFLNMAIEALEQEPSEDCISRKRLRESLKRELVIVNNNEMYWQGWHDCTVAVETRITDAPSVVPKRGKWIPLNAIGGEPEEEGIYLLQLSDGFINSTYYDGKDWELWADAGKPVAWMPLPEPYEEGAEQ